MEQMWKEKDIRKGSLRWPGASTLSPTSVTMKFRTPGWDEICGVVQNRNRAEGFLLRMKIHRRTGISLNTSSSELWPMADVKIVVGMNLATPFELNHVAIAGQLSDYSCKRLIVQGDFVLEKKDVERKLLLTVNSMLATTCGCAMVVWLMPRCLNSRLSPQIYHSNPSMFKDFTSCE